MYLCGEEKARLLVVPQGGVLAFQGDVEEALWPQLAWVLCFMRRNT